MDGLLDGMRVVELSTMVSGPYGGLLLRQMGADVVKVEPPDGDPVRGYSPREDDRSATYYNYNRGKRSVAVDLKRPEGVEIVRRLAATADVVVENWRPGVARRLGLDLAMLRADHPRLVTVATRGFGDDGPYAGGRAYDSVIQCASGITPVQGTSEHPELVRTLIADKLTAVAWVQAALAALVRRSISGEGSHVSVAMIDVLVAFLWPDVGASLTFAEVERDPLADPYRKNRAGSIVVGRDGKPFFCTSMSGREWRSLCAVLDRPELVDEYDSVALRVRHQDVLRQAVQERFAGCTRDEALAVLRAADIPCAPVNAPADLLTDEHVRASGLLREVERDGYGIVREAAPLWDLGDREVDIGPAPLLGADTQAVLTEVGFDQPTIDHLAATGVVTLGQ